jgi:hypothetical protein
MIYDLLVFINKPLNFTNLFLLICDKSKTQ